MQRSTSVKTAAKMSKFLSKQSEHAYSWVRYPIERDKKECIESATYLVVSLCSTAVASMTVVVYSMPVVRLVPRLW